jgi:Flp pilus assembly protein TadG
MQRRELLSDQQGIAAVLVVVFTGAAMALAALGADVGMLMAERQKLAGAADMAALSGAQLLPENRSGAAGTARRLLREMGVPDETAEVSVSDDGRRLRILVQTERQAWFARTFGVAAAAIAAGAEARAENVSGVRGAVPLGIPSGSYVLGQQVTLRGAANGGAVGPGNFQALAFADDRGSRTYSDTLRNGFDGWVRVGQWIDTEPGVAAGPTRDALRDRIQSDPTATWQTVRKGSRRLVIVPMLVDWEINGRSQVRVVGFGLFFLETTRVNGGQVEVTGYFIRQVIAGEGSAEAPDFGARTVKLRG